MLDATRSAGIARIRRAVPEFEDTFQDELREEEGQLGAFQAMSVFADWVGERIARGVIDDATTRAFSVVEDLLTDNEVELGDALAAEFIEALWNNAHALQLMGSKTRERAMGRA